MKNLFKSLHRYRSRDTESSNLEDWLTECLAAVLRSMSSDEWRSFLVELLDEQAENVENALAIGVPEVRTQIDGGRFGRPDAGIFVGGQPVVLFENKVAHTVGGAGGSETEARHQLQRYAHWLRENCGQAAFAPALIFLTHITQPPADYLAAVTVDDGYRGVRRMQESWGVLGRRLAEITGGEEAGTLSGALAEALLGMLEQEGMENEFPDTIDIAATQLFLAHGSTVENLIEQMWRKVATVASSNKMSARVVTPLLEYGRYCAYRYVNRAPAATSSNIFIETGLWFPEIGNGWESSDIGPTWSRSPQVFLLYGSDDDGTFSSIEGNPGEGWLRPDTDFLIIRRLDELEGTPDRRAAAILDWLDVEGKKLRRFLLEHQLTT